MRKMGNDVINFNDFYKYFSLGFICLHNAIYGKRLGMMNLEYCSQCNPEFFVLYGYCTNCGKRCNPPLHDFKDMNSCPITQKEWEEYPEYLTYEQLKDIKNGKINFIAKPVKDEFHLTHNPL